VISHLREQESILVQRQAEMEARLSPQYPSVAPVRAQLASVRQLITAELNRVVATMQGDYSRALIDEQLLTVEVERAKTETAAVRQASVKLRELERDLEANRAVYAAFLARAHETGEQIGIDTTNVRIITRATPPEQKSWPPLGLLLMGAIGSGIGLGSGLALILEYVTPTILSRGQIERNAGAPVIGILPRAALVGGRHKLSHGTLHSKASPSALAIMGLALRRLYNVGEDSTLRERIGVRSLLVTSGIQDADVRREVCGLLAEAATMRGDRVLLVDGDVASGRPETTPGLLDVLHGEHTLSSLVDLAPPTGVAFLGKGRDRRSAIVRNRSWNGAVRMLTEATQHFDIVIVDGGEVAENLQIAPLLTASDEVLLVGQLARTSQNDVVRAADAATTMGRPISAVLLVDAMEQS
jgi:Mrp family chromosome partitioning ATPase